ncbi:hypothetical protein AruPA_15220 [Acidiphilium sp. PA]|uniref:hypothetical protein n=1 Tax=Acidiphilium sp. PA TaxID=2871705 RepID=UPI002244D1C7|nr:hypothetical protein [Acidiphilium sp. PA]MCW8308388.1 hypothetical protein [Acidiphilium sp. PA]
MSGRWRWLRVRRGFTINHDGRAFAAGDLMRVKASEARAWAASTSPAKPWFPVRVAYSAARAVRLIRQAIGETSAARRRAAQRRRRAAEAVRRRATVVRMVRK